MTPEPLFSSRGEPKDEQTKDFIKGVEAETTEQLTEQLKEPTKSRKAIRRNAETGLKDYLSTGGTVFPHDHNDGKKKVKLRFSDYHSR
jgi:hypothetical protein